MRGYVEIHHYARDDPEDDRPPRRLSSALTQRNDRRHALCCEPVRF